ncbi:hypothetical protein ACN261_27825 [Micromonospora sp. WMMD723]|uniref:hypothetical protein n=1 Tax=unclassified Micromonospora TaxID=2617518 RepID=UPI003B92B1CF
MTEPTPTAGVRHPARWAVLILAGLSMVSGCSGGVGAGEPGSDATPAPSPSSAVMRLDKPATVLGTWHESLDRRLTQVAQDNMGQLKVLLDGEPLSALGTAYIPVREKHSAERGLYRPGDDRVVLLSGVSGTVGNPERTLDLVFTRLSAISGVEPVPPGPLGGSARCGYAHSRGIRIDVCAWADRHTLGMVHLTHFAPTARPEEIFRQIRAQTEHAAS